MHGLLGNTPNVYRKNIFEDFLYRFTEQGPQRSVFHKFRWHHVKVLPEITVKLWKPQNQFFSLTSLNFCNIRSQKFSWNFNNSFRKFPQKFSQDFDKILLENCSNLSNSLPKIFRKFSIFCRISTLFPLIFHHISTFSQLVNKVLKNFLKNLLKIFFYFQTVLYIFCRSLLFFLKIFQNID